MRSCSGNESRWRALGGMTSHTEQQNGGVWLEKTEELSWRAETLSSALKRWLKVSRRAGGTLSARTEVDLEAVKANHVLFLLHSLGPNMCPKAASAVLQLQRAWRAAFLKHIQGRHLRAWRWTHSGAAPTEQ